jgi:hypothetical protein
MALLGRLAIILASLSVAGPALAADAIQEPLPPVESVDSGWTFTVTPYLWMAGLDGDVGLFGREPVPIDQKFGDILGDLEFAGTVVAELHNGSGGVVADVMYVKTSSDSEITRTIGGVPGMFSLASAISGTTVFRPPSAAGRWEEDGFVYDVVQHGPILGCNNLGAVHRGSIRHRDYLGVILQVRSEPA